MAVIAVGALVVVGAALLAIQQLRQIALDHAEANLRNLTRAIAAQSEVVLGDTDVVLHTLRDWQEGHPGFTAEQLHDQFSKQLNIPRFMRAVSYFGADGALRQISNPDLPFLPINARDREWFQLVRDGTTRDIVIAEPIESRLNHRWLIPLAIRVESADGRFAGALAASLDPSYFQSLFNKYDLGEGSAITLQRRDSTILVRQPHDPSLYGKRFIDGPAYRALTGHQDAVVHAVSVIDGHTRILAAQVLEHYPAYIVVSATEAEALRGWRLQAEVIAGAAILLLTVLAVLGHSHLRLSGLVGELCLAQEALRQRQELFEQIFASSAAIVMLIDPVDGRIIDANPAAVDFYGWTAPALRGLDFTLLHAEAPEITGDRLREAAAGTRSYFVTTHQLADGSTREVEIYSGRLHQQGRLLLVSIIHDVSDRLRNERELAAAHQRLQDQTEELARSNAELEQFAYVASHDLREPLRMVNSFLKLIERRLGDKVDGDTREMIGFATDGAQRMDRLILDLLEYSRIGRNAPAPEAVAMGKVVSEALENLRVSIEDCQATITIPDEMPTVPGHANELVRLLQNLIGNALKYRDGGRSPVITLSVGRDGRYWRFALTDNGIGVDPALCAQVFGIFKRLHTRDAYDGTGIGLAVCKKIVEHHGGTIAMASDGEGKGVTVTFTLAA